MPSTTAPSLNTTSPVGVPLLAVTVKLIVTLWPTTEGSGVSLVIAVVVLALVTLTVLLQLLFASLVSATTLFGSAAQVPLVRGTA